MKPDEQKTGSVESTNSVEGINVEKNTKNIPPKSEIISPVSPSPGLTHNTQLAEPLGSAQHLELPAQTPQDGSNNFENQLAQLPAEDSGSIEKEWVTKANEIVAKTNNDPYFEDEAQHSLSRAYLKKRFNLDIE